MQKLLKWNGVNESHGQQVATMLREKDINIMAKLGKWTFFFHLNYPTLLSANIQANNANCHEIILVIRRHSIHASPPH